MKYIKIMSSNDPQSATSVGLIDAEKITAINTRPTNSPCYNQGVVIEYDNGQDIGNLISINVDDNLYPCDGPEVDSKGILALITALQNAHMVAQTSKHAVVDFYPPIGIVATNVVLT